MGDAATGGFATAEAGRGDGSVRRADGRALAFREYGALDGMPVFYFHGSPGSRLDFAANHGAAAAAGVRVIALDRPGIGGSDHQRGRRVLDWPADVAAVADALGLDRFAVLGFSLGGPYARACGYALAQRVTRVVLVSTVGPVDDPAAGEALLPRPLRLTLALARRSPALALPLAWLNARQTRAAPVDPGRDDWISPADAAVLSRPEVAACLRAGGIESFRSGLRGAVQDSAAVARGEGFLLEDVAADVQIWHGEDDRSAPVAMARSQERRIPRASARYIKDGGHLILFSHAAEILAGVKA